MYKTILAFPLVLILVLSVSCADKVSSIKPDPAYVDKTVNGSRKVLDESEYEAIRTRVAGKDPCIQDTYQWGDYSCSSNTIDGTKGKIFYQQWERSSIDNKKPVTLFIVTGRAEFTEKYFETVSTFIRTERDAGGLGNGHYLKRVVVYDHYGQGRSQGENGHGNLTVYVSDLVKVINDRSQEKNAYNLVLAHSMGGLVATSLMQNQLVYLKGEDDSIPKLSKRVQGFAFSAPMYLASSGKVPFAQAAFLAINKAQSYDKLKRYPRTAMEKAMAEEMLKGKNPTPEELAFFNPYTDDLKVEAPFAKNSFGDVGDPTFEWLNMTFSVGPKLIFNKNNWYQVDRPKMFLDSNFLLIHSDEDKIVNSSSFDKNFFYKDLKNQNEVKDNPSLLGAIEYLEANNVSATNAFCSLMNDYFKIEIAKRNPTYTIDDLELVQPCVRWTEKKDMSGHAIWTTHPYMKLALQTLKEKESGLVDLDNILNMKFVEGKHNHFMTSSRESYVVKTYAFFSQVLAFSKEI